jgi:hypothetical protein
MTEKYSVITSGTIIHKKSVTMLGAISARGRNRLMVCSFQEQARNHGSKASKVEAHFSGYLRSSGTKLPGLKCISQQPRQAYTAQAGPWGLQGSSRCHCPARARPELYFL